MQAQTTATDLEAIQQRERDMAQMEVTIKKLYKLKNYYKIIKVCAI